MSIIKSFFVARGAVMCDAVIMLLMTVGGSYGQVMTNRV